MSIEIAAPPSPQPKAAGAGLGPSGKPKMGAQGGSSIDDSGSFSTLLAVSTENTDHADSVPGQDAVRKYPLEGLPGQRVVAQGVDRKSTFF